MKLNLLPTPFLKKLKLFIPSVTLLCCANSAKADIYTWFYKGGPANITVKTDGRFGGICPGNITRDCLTVTVENNGYIKYTWYGWGGPYSGNSITPPPPINDMGSFDGEFICENWVEIENEPLKD